jgi:thiol-disulfide isomerase/thioredoxin
MKRHPLILAALLAVLCSCSRTGMVDNTGSGASSGTSSSTPASASSRTSASTAANLPPKSPTPVRIGYGEFVNLQEYVSKGRMTIFDFTSEYCGPCRGMAPLLHKLHEDRADVVVVEVDINRPGFVGIDWASPVSRQFGLQSIPNFKVYGPDGRLQAEGDIARSIVDSMVR